MSNVVWVSCNTTSLDTQVANIYELSYIKQRDGVFEGEIQTLLVSPLKHEFDKVLSKYNIDEFIGKYNSTGDRGPDYTLTSYYKKTLYTQSALDLASLSIETLLKRTGTVTPECALDTVKTYLDGGKLWTVAGYSDFCLPLLRDYSRRVGSDLRDLLDVDAVNIFTVVKELKKISKTLLPVGKTSLAAVAQSLGVPYNRSSAGKLKATLQVTDLALGESLRANCSSPEVFSR